MIQLAKNPSGLIYKCEKCRKIHIEFGSFLLKYTLDEFRQFAEYIININEKSFHCKRFDSNKKILIPIGHPDLQLLLTWYELKNFQSLLRIAKSVHHEYSDFNLKYMQHNYN